MELASEFKVISHGVDYITCTTNNPVSGRQAFIEGSSLLQNQAESGFKIRPWGMRGFKGWRAGEVEYGERNHERIIRLSGWLAHTNWRRIYALADNVSRIDVECTTRSNRHPNERIAGYRKAFRNSVRRARRPQGCRWVRDSAGGFTFYLGSRQSDTFGRIYNKEAESDIREYVMCTRHEVEAKNDIALSWARQFAAASPQENLPFTFVLEYFSTRACFSRMELDAARSLNSGPKSSFALNQTQSYKSVCDDTKALEWLRVQVKPTVERLVARGLGEATLELLFGGCRSWSGPSGPQEQFSIVESEVVN